MDAWVFGFGILLDFVSTLRGDGYFTFGFLFDDLAGW